MGELLPRLSILTLAGGFFLLHFPGSRLRLMLSAILPYEARTFLTLLPFGTVARGRLAELCGYYSTRGGFCQGVRLTRSLKYAILIMNLR